MFKHIKVCLDLVESPGFKFQLDPNLDPVAWQASFRREGPESRLLP